MLSESQAILQYLADQFELEDLYPRDPQPRARVNDFCYPQIYPHHRRQTDEAQARTITLGEILRVDLSDYPNVTRWIGRMKQLESWNRVNEAHHAFTESTKDREFDAL